MQKGGTMDMTKKVVAPVAKPAATNPAGNYDPNTGQPISAKGKADAASQAAFNASPQGKAMDAYFKDQQAGKFKGTFKQWQQQQAQQPAVAEDLDANQKRVGQLGPTEKVKNNNIGKLVGANENFINTDAQAVVTEVDTGEYDARKSSSKGETTPEQEKEFRKKVQAYGKELEQRQKEKVKEGQDDLNAIKRLLGK
jgi:hypothetical protein